MHFICRSFIGKNGPQNWSQYWENEPDDFNLKLKKGHLFGLVDIFSDQDQDIRTTGHNFISQINEQYFSDTSDGIISSLKQSFNQVQLGENYQINLILVVVLDQKIFIASFGPNKIALNRGSQISLLINSSTESEFNSISGPIKAKDRVVLMTNSFFEKINWEKIKSTLVDQDLQNIEENVLSFLYLTENQNHLSAALIEVHHEDEFEPPSNETKEEQPPQTHSSPSIKPVFVGT